MPKDEDTLVRKRDRQDGPTAESPEIPTFGLPRVVFQPKKNREVSITRTLRLNSEVNEKLEELSKRQNISINVLANKAFRKLVEWDSRAEALGIVSIQRSTLRDLWDSLPEEKARALGRRAGGQKAVDFSNLLFKKFSWNTIVEAARLWGEEYGGLYHFQHDFTDAVHTLIFYHRLGRNFTAYLSEAYKETIKLLVADCENVESEKQLLIRVKR